MFSADQAFCGFAVDDTVAARSFYADVLGIEVTGDDHGMLELHLGSGAHVLVYPKDTHHPAEHTILNFPVADIDSAVDDLLGRGVTFIRYEGVDDRGIMRGRGPDIAWFTDPAGNILSVIGQPTQG
jgi:catechol-2,3-dioxygenase